MMELKTKYIWYWLKDQLSHPGWFERLFVHRTAWGAFTVYSHLRRTDNKEKIGYKTREDAQQAADSMKKKYGAEFVVYKCLYCDDWHVSKDVRATEAKRKASEAKALKQFSVKESERSDSLDVELILSTKIPDLAPVYGGFRGRTLSSQRQLPVWSKMVEGGIRQVIDLRADYKSSFYQDLCKKGGVGYFHYPVAYEEERIARMAELFPELCRLIDEGRFYIACAQGLHRTDIALCSYWMFYAADKGMDPPALRGYLKVKGMNTAKIMRVLNALYKYWTEKNGTSPIPEDVFRERKEIIKELNLRKESE